MSEKTGQNQIQPLCFALDLTWVRHGIVGGTESFVCNLLEGFAECVKEQPGSAEIVLLTAKDNREVFRKYECREGIRGITCNVLSADRKGRLLWQNLKMGKMLKKMGITRVLEPVYSKPFLGPKEIRYVTVIHDLLAWHFPEYFSKKRVLWMKNCWRNTVKTSAQVIAISEYTKQDILAKMPYPGAEIAVIPNPIVISSESSGKEVLEHYHVAEKGYYYTVSSQVPHKNLSTLLRAMGILKRKQSAALRPLLITGVGGGVTGELQQIIKEEQLEDEIRFTGFISDAERNALYKNCKAFLFPSIFEGFGMPPIEAMVMQVPVLTTECASIKEVTGGLLNYVADPKDPAEWAERLETELQMPAEQDTVGLLTHYEKRRCAEQYLKCLGEQRL
ncbi:MAG: glycosyltransferase family 4 protein [Lachnospiraceae bacterium]|nr:glycosyltransferase family 4 protein [Lachnospiraceae bacterium]